jgi:hypothetical protein
MKGLTGIALCLKGNALFIGHFQSTEGAAKVHTTRQTGQIAVRMRAGPALLKALRGLGAATFTESGSQKVGADSIAVTISSPTCESPTPKLGLLRDVSVCSG